MQDMSLYSIIYLYRHTYIYFNATSPCHELVFSMAPELYLELRSCKANHRRGLIVFKWRMSCQKWVVHWPLSQVQWMLAWTLLFPHSIAKDLAWLNMHLTSLTKYWRLLLSRKIWTLNNWTLAMGWNRYTHAHLRIYEPSSHLHIIYTYLYDILCLDTYIDHKSHLIAVYTVLRPAPRTWFWEAIQPTDPCSGKNDLKQSRMDYCIYIPYYLHIYNMYIYI